MFSAGNLLASGIDRAFPFSDRVVAVVAFQDRRADDRSCFQTRERDTVVSIQGTFEVDRFKI